MLEVLRLWLMLVPLAVIPLVEADADEPSEESLLRKCLNENGFSSRRGSSGIAPVSESTGPAFVVLPVDLWPNADECCWCWCCKSLLLWTASGCEPISTPLVLPLLLLLLP